MQFSSSVQGVVEARQGEGRAYVSDGVEVDRNERLGVDVLEVPAERLALELPLERQPLGHRAVVGARRARVHHRVEHACTVHTPNSNTHAHRSTLL